VPKPNEWANVQVVISYHVADPLLDRAHESIIRVLRNSPIRIWVLPFEQENDLCEGLGLERPEQGYAGLSGTRQVK